MVRRCGFDLFGGSDRDVVGVFLRGCALVPALRVGVPEYVCGHGLRYALLHGPGQLCCELTGSTRLHEQIYNH